MVGALIAAMFIILLTPGESRETTFPHKFFKGLTTDFPAFTNIKLKVTISNDPYMPLYEYAHGVLYELDTFIVTAEGFPNETVAFEFGYNHLSTTLPRYKNSEELGRYSYCPVLGCDDESVGYRLMIETIFHFENLATKNCA